MPRATQTAQPGASLEEVVKVFVEQFGFSMADVLDVARSPGEPNRWYILFKDESYGTLTVAIPPPKPGVQL